jgi:hypothetical protein
MKKIIPLLILLVGSIIAQPHFREQFNPGKLDSVSVTGKIISTVLKDSSKTFTLYYLDTNGDGKADYILDFGPSWYKPIDSTAAKPSNGDSATIIGGKTSEQKDSLSIIVVYQINGKTWRDPFLAGWNDIGKRDSLGGFFHPKNSNNGYGHNLKVDSLITKTLSGTALVDTTLKIDQYFLDTDGDNLPNYILNFGPPWYKPTSGATRPLNGDKITIVAGILGSNCKYPMAIVYELNGKVWLDSAQIHKGVSGNWPNNNGTTKVSSIFDSLDNLQFQQGHIGPNIKSNISAQLFESNPENMPSYKGQNIFAAYEVSIADNNGNDLMVTNNGHNGGQMEASSKVSLQLHYTSDQLSYYGLAEINLKAKVWSQTSNSWQLVNASVNTSTKTVTFTSSTLGNYYALTGSTSVTEVSEANSIPTGYLLQQNYPNPFNPTTVISYSLPVAGNVSLKIYDILGNEVAKLAQGYKNAGNYTVIFDGKNLASGIYLYRLESGNFVAVKKLTLIK